MKRFFELVLSGLLLAQYGLAVSMPLPWVHSIGFYGITASRSNFNPDASTILGLFTPFYTQENHAWFVDARLKLDLSRNTSHHESNLGIVGRQVLPFKNLVIAGGYAFWDLSHVQDNTYVNQLTVGAEVITRKYHANVNTYWAQQDFTTDYASAASSSIRSFDKHYFITNQTGTLATIKPLSGMDAMLEVDMMHTRLGSLALLGGYKYFNKTGFLTMEGPKVGVVFKQSAAKYSRRWELFTAYDGFHGNSWGTTFTNRWYTAPTKRLSLFSKLITTAVVRDVDIPLAYLPLQSVESEAVLPLLSQEEKKVNAEIVEGLFDFFVVNLDRDRDRLQRFSAMMADHGFVFKRKPAIDGYTLDKEDLKKSALVSPRAARVLHRGEIAVALSQKSIWEDNKQNPKPYIVVFEDDVRLPADFSTKMMQLATMINNHEFDVLFLGRTTWAHKICNSHLGWDHHGCVKTTAPKKSDAPITLAPFSWGGFAYVAATNSLPSLSEAYSTIDRPLDAQWWLPEYQLKMATVNPLWMDQYSTDLYDSHSFGVV